MHLIQSISQSYFLKHINSWKHFNIRYTSAANLLVGKKNKTMMNMISNIISNLLQRN